MTDTQAMLAELRPGAIVWHSREEVLARALSEIDRLQQENARLREALRVVTPVMIDAGMASLAGRADILRSDLSLAFKVMLDEAIARTTLEAKDASDD